MPAPDSPPPYLSPALKTRVVAIEDLRTLPGNPRRGDIDRIKASLRRFGQRYPSVVRGDVLLAGNNRKQAMMELGWTHVVVVDADDLDEEEARAFALADNRTSDLATYDVDELADMLETLDEELREVVGYSLDDMADLSSALDSLGHAWDPIPGAAPNLGVGGEPREPGTPPPNYSRKIEAPIYEPRGEKPPIDSLLDAGKTVELQTEILTHPTLTSEERAFLLAAAERHTVFRFDRIADFYAHSSSEVQALMEKSGLVIVDFDKAIEAGFVQMSEAIAAQYRADREDGFEDEGQDDDES